MMEQLASFQEKVARRAALKKEFEDLETQYEALEKELFSLKIDAHNQQVDVDLLNCFSLKNLYYDLTGKKEGMLAKETSEARAAKEKLDQAQYRLEQISRRLEGCSSEISALSGCEAEYWSFLLSGAPSCAEVRRALTERKETLVQQLQEAFDAGTAALEQIHDTLINIDNVMKWNLSLAGTGWVMSIPGYMNGVQKKIEVLRKLVIVFIRKLDSLPLAQDQILSPKEILCIPKDHFREISGNIGADQRLREADNALHETKDRIFTIQSAIEKAQKELSNM